MKIKSSIIFLTLLLLVNLINGATLYTPNGKSINTFDANRSSYNSAHFEAYKSNNFGTDNLYPNSEVLGQYEDGLWEYNCHVFAWNNWQGTEKWNSESDMWKLGKPSPNDLMWRNFPDVWYEDSDNPIGIVSYIEANNSSEASIVTYKLNNTITHSARIVGSGYR